MPHCGNCATLGAKAGISAARINIHTDTTTDSLAITVGLAWGSWDLLKDAVKMGLLAVPRHIDETAVREFLFGHEGVTAVRDLRIWGMSTTESALIAHLVMPSGTPGDACLHQIAQDLEKRFGIHHATIQVETSMAECSLGHEHKH
ncbi:MAG: hypothetical protein C0515_10380 [Novosphingobium sp.]|nr:hypothetical protein [Novosphingobium sp.]